MVDLISNIELISKMELISNMEWLHGIGTQLLGQLSQETITAAPVRRPEALDEGLLGLLPMFATIALVILMTGAEALHLVRIRKIAPLAFGAKAKPALWASLAPALRIIAVGLLCWGLASLLVMKPKTHNSVQIEEAQQRHVVLLLDVSPSMRLRDAGPEAEQSRTQRARVVLESLFDRVPIRQYKLSVIAFYDKAIPVVVDTKDMEVVANCLNDLPMHYAFSGRETNLFAGLETVAEVTKPWQPKSTIVLVISDGDTVPPTGMPKMPVSVADMLVIGVGDPVTGKFINGKNSRQDVSMLRQVATRMSGEFHNGNSKHISSDMITRLTRDVSRARWGDLGLREYALAAITIGAILLSLLPIALHYLGTKWHPGVHRSQAVANQQQERERRRRLEREREAAEV